LRLFRNDAPHGREIAVTVTAQNDAPVAVDDVLAATEDRAATFTAAQIVGNDTDGDGDARTLQSVTAGTGGSVVLNADGGVTFTPDANFNGPAHFTYVVGDGHGGTDEGAAVVNVASVNDAPALAGLAPSVTFAENDVNAVPRLLDPDVAFSDVEAISTAATSLSRACSPRTGWGSATKDRSRPRSTSRAPV